MRNRKDLIKNKILITGASGFLGGNLAIHAARQWRVYATYNNTPIPFSDLYKTQMLDVTDRASVVSVIHSISPMVIVHCAAITNMNYCAEHPEEAFKVNVKGSENIAMAAKEIGARLLYISTDLVFDGDRSFYDEEDHPSPICEYGRTKLAGEQIVSSHNANSCIVRSALAFGRSKNSSRCFTERMIEKLRHGHHVQLFADEYRTPIYIHNLCDALLELACLRNTGVYNLAGSERISRHDFGLLAAEIFGLDNSLIHKISISEFKFKDKRPEDCSMSNKKAARLLSTSFYNAKTGLREMENNFLP